MSFGYRLSPLFHVTWYDIKLYEFSRRKPGWRFTAGVKYLFELLRAVDFRRESASHLLCFILSEAQSRVSVSFFRNDFYDMFIITVLLNVFRISIVSVISCNLVRYKALRVFPAETRLTVHRRRQVGAQNIANVVRSTLLQHRGQGAPSGKIRGPWTET